MTAHRRKMAQASAIVADLEDVAGRVHLTRAAAHESTWLRVDDYVCDALASVGSLYVQLDATRRELVRYAVEHTDLTKRQICRQVGITRRTLDHWIARWAEQPPPVGMPAPRSSTS